MLLTTIIEKLPYEKLITYAPVISKIAQNLITSINSNRSKKLTIESRLQSLEESLDQVGELGNKIAQQSELQAATFEALKQRTRVAIIVSMVSVLLSLFLLLYLIIQ
jgi:predicted PurR-regulated permease PerM